MLVKVEFLMKSVAKLNEYYDKNRLKSISILEFTTEIETLER
jgi:hypothetical protein